MTHLILTLSRWFDAAYVRFSMCIRTENYGRTIAKYDGWNLVGVSAYDEYVPLTN